MDWTDEVIARLRALWAEGHSTAEIGRRMGVSKNAVVGKAHRLVLPPRPSPIRRAGTGQAPKRTTPRRTTGPTLPPLGAHVSGSTASAPLERDREIGAGFAAATAFRPIAPSARPAPQGVELQNAGSPPLTLQTVTRSGGGRHIACCWPIGEPGTRSFRFCDAKSVAGKPYCPEHAALAYVKVRDKREEAA